MRLRGDRGFTLIELMIALALLGIVTSQLFLVFSSQKKAYVTNERILDVQEDARLVIDLLVGETRMAGYMVPRRAGIATIDGTLTTTSTPDTLCVSDPAVLDDNVVANADGRFDGAQVSVLAPNRITLATAGDFDIDGLGGNDFQIGLGIILADGDSSFCARIVAVNTVARTIDFVPNLSVVLGNPIPADFAIGPTVVVPAVIYEVGTSATGGGIGLTRNGMLISDEVEDLQIVFGLDADGDNLVDITDAAEFPIHSIAALDPSPLRAVQITVTTRHAAQDPEFTGPGSNFTAVANRVAGATDNRRRRRFVTSVVPRNLL
jgi:prepilin-type N-terminal cleavage/methylation domain-containing protein